MRDITTLIQITKGKPGSAFLCTCFCTVTEPYINSVNLGRKESWRRLGGFLLSKFLSQSWRTGWCSQGQGDRGGVSAGYRIMGLPRWLGGKESTCQYKRHRRCSFHLWVRKIPWRRKWQPTPASLARRSPWTEEPGRLQSMGVTKSQTGLSTHARTESYPGDGWKLLACSCTERPNSIQGNWFRNFSR